MRLSRINMRQSHIIKAYNIFISFLFLAKADRSDAGRGQLLCFVPDDARSLRVKVLNPPGSVSGIAEGMRV